MFELIPGKLKLFRSTAPVSSHAFLDKIENSWNVMGPSTKRFYCYEKFDTIVLFTFRALH